MFPPNLIRAYSKNPNKWVRDVLHVEEVKPWQDKVLEDLGRGDKPVSVRSGAGVGKTALESWAILWYLSTKPYPKVPCTAPTEHHLFDVLWAECSKWMRRSPILMDNLQWTQTKIFMKGHAEEWFAIARTCRANKDGFVSEGLQGFHADFMLFVVDEASGMDDQALAAVDGIMATGQGQILMCGNPVRLNGMFFDSHNKYPELFCTHHVNCLTTPGITEAYIKLMDAKYGRGSAMWLSKVEGEFPTEESYVLFNPRKVEALYDPEAAVRDTLPTIGCDIADGGGDQSVYIVRRGDTIIDIVTPARNLDTEGNADAIQQLAKSYAPYRKILIDTVGVGTGVLSTLRRRKMANVYGIKGSWDASDPKMVLNHRCESYQLLSQLVRSGRLRSTQTCERLKQDLLRHFQIPNEDGLFQVTTKTELRKKGNSPDYSDALAVSYGHELSKPRKEVTGSRFLEINRGLSKTALFVPGQRSAFSERRSSRFDMENS